MYVAIHRAAAVKVERHEHPDFSTITIITTDAQGHENGEVVIFSATPLKLEGEVNEPV